MHRIRSLAPCPLCLSLPGAGSGHIIGTCADQLLERGNPSSLQDRGHVYCMGDNEFGSLGINKKQLSFSPTPCLVEYLLNQTCRQIACGSGQTLALMESGEVFSWGKGQNGELGLPTLDNYFYPQKVDAFSSQPKSLSVTKLGCGFKHSVALTNLGHVYVFGSNDQGQIGRGELQKQQTPEKLDLRDRIADIACGYMHTLLLTANGEVVATGSNQYGQLGTARRFASNQAALPHTP